MKSVKVAHNPNTNDKPFCKNYEKNRERFSKVQKTDEITKPKSQRIHERDDSNKNMFFVRDRKENESRK